MANRTRTNRNEICLDDREQYILDEKFRLSGMKSKSAFLRKLILYGYVYDVDYSFLRTQSGRTTHSAFPPMNLLYRPFFLRIKVYAAKVQGCLYALLEKYDASLKTPVKDLPNDAIDEILYGSDERIKIKSSLIGTSSDYFVTYEGVVKYIQMLQEKDASATAQKWAEQFAKTTVCPECIYAVW